jgi:hypothetical protein
MFANIHQLMAVKLGQVVGTAMRYDASLTAALCCGCYGWQCVAADKLMHTTGVLQGRPVTPGLTLQAGSTPPTPDTPWS